MDILFSNFLDKPVWMWIFFILIVLVLLILDLGVFHRNVREIGVKESLALSAFYITLGLFLVHGFGGILDRQQVLIT